MPTVVQAFFMAVGERWLAVAGLPVESNICVFAARVVRVVAERQRVAFRVMPAVN